MPWLIEWRQILFPSYAVLTPSKLCLGVLVTAPVFSVNRVGVASPVPYMIVNARGLVLYTYLFAACCRCDSRRKSDIGLVLIFGRPAGLCSTSTGWVLVVMLHAHHVISACVRVVCLMGWWSCSRLLQYVTVVATKSEKLSCPNGASTSCYAWTFDWC